jgi:hypothetical protein
MADPDPKRKPDPGLHIQLDDDVAQGLYINLAMVNHTETEFVLDFIYVQPHQPRAKVRSRLISSPRHTKRLLLALKDNVDKYEARFGIIDVTPAGAEPPASLN